MHQNLSLKQYCTAFEDAKVSQPEKNTGSSVGIEDYSKLSGVISSSALRTASVKNSR